MFALNANHITHIGISDVIQLKKGPTAQTGGGVVKLQSPRRVLHALLVTLITDMVIDLRGADNAERARDIQWVMVYPITPNQWGGRSVAFYSI
jgi:hypothetical protein